jgi:curved DNA-binding protein CbpA
VAKRDPHDVLGIEPGATPTQVKAAWRRLARQHHPDLIGDDPEASRVATRRMAEINEAYAALTREGGPLDGAGRVATRRRTARARVRPAGRTAPAPAVAARLGRVRRAR